MNNHFWREEPISKKHDRTQFDCGVPELNTYLCRYARQSHESGAAKTYLAIDTVTEQIIGYYSITPASADYEDYPADARKNLPRHPVPGFRLARLAVSCTCQSNGLGTQLLLAAGRRCLRAASEMGGVALFIDAKNDAAAAWYKSRGAIDLDQVDANSEILLAIPLSTIRIALETANKA